MPLEQTKNKETFKNSTILKKMNLKHLEFNKTDRNHILNFYNPSPILH